MTDTVATFESWAWRESAAEANGLIRWRETVRFLVVVSAIIIDGVSLVLAAFTATAFRFSGLAPGSTIDLIAATAPAFLLAGTALGAYRLEILSRMSISIRRVLSALLVAGMFGLTAAFALKATANYSRLETGYM